MLESTSAENTFDVNAIYFDKDEKWISIDSVEEVLNQYHIFRANVSVTNDPMLPFSKAIALVASYMANGIEYTALKQKYKSDLWGSMLFHNSTTKRPRWNMAAHSPSQLGQTAGMTGSIPTGSDVVAYTENYLRHGSSIGLHEIRFLIYIIECACTLIGLRSSTILGPDLCGDSNATPLQLAKALGKSQFFTEFKNIA